MLVSVLCILSVSSEQQLSQGNAHRCFFKRILINSDPLQIGFVVPGVCSSTVVIWEAGTEFQILYSKDASELCEENSTQTGGENTSLKL